MFAKASFRTVIAGIAALGAVASIPAHAQAQDLIDFLWGGGEEWGGKRQVVSFNSQYKAGQIIVSFGDRRLYLIEKAGTAVSYPIAVPREQSRWQGKTSVTMKKENPSWTPTPDMFKENPKLPSWVPGGHPMNPLGVRALYLGSSTYRIHGTDAPWTIGQAVSKGCIRMFNEDVLDLYPRVPVGTVVTVTWEKFKTGTSSVETSSVGSTQPVVVTTEEPAASSAPSSDASAEVVEQPKQSRKAARYAGQDESVYSDEGYSVDASGGKPLVTKYGRKPLVTRTSATPQE